MIRDAHYTDDEAAELFAYGWNGVMNPTEYVRLWVEHLAARKAFYAQPWWKRAIDRLRGKGVNQWEGV